MYQPSQSTWIIIQFSSWFYFSSFYLFLLPSAAFPICTCFVNHRGDNNLLVLLFASSLMSLPFFCFPSFHFLLTLVFPLKLRWNCLLLSSLPWFLPLSDCYCFLSFTPFCQYSSFSLFRDERMCCLFPCSSLSPSHALKFLSLSQVFSAKMKRSLLSSVCCLRSESFFLRFFATCCSSDGSGQTKLTCCALLMCSGGIG